MPKKKSVSLSAKLTKNPTKIRSVLTTFSKNRKNNEFPKPRIGIEEDLFRRTKELETLAENAPDVIFRIDRNLRFVFVNRKVGEFTGIPKEQFYGKTLLELGLPKDFCNALGEKAQEVFDRQSIREFEFKFAGPAGIRQFQTRMVPEFDPSGTVEKVVGIATDITDLKKAEMAFREEHAFRESIERSLRIGIVATDLEGRQSYVNPYFCKMVGWSKEELLGAKPPFVYWPVEEMETITKAFNQALHGEDSPSLELRFQRKDGERFDALILLSALKDGQGKVIGWIESIGDITERKRKGEEIRRLNIELEGRVRQRTSELTKKTGELENINKELEAFAYSVSHDLKGPLIVIDGFVKRMEDHYSDKLDARGRQYLQHVCETSRHMMLLIEDLLKLSKVTKSTIRLNRVDLSDLAKSITTQLQETFPTRKVEFVIQEGLISLGAPRLLRVALENLLSNAWKFTSNCRKATIEFGLTQMEGDPAFFVRDNGCGFNMTNADNLFKPFQRLHSSEEFSGTGIGLATVQRIIHRHGGRIWAESTVGKGATFYFTLPS